MRKRHEHAATWPHDPRQLGQRLGVARLLDVLEHRDRVRVVERRVLERERAAVRNPQVEPGHGAGQGLPVLDLPLQLVDRRYVDASPREHDREELGAGEIEDTVATPRSQTIDRPRQLEIAARIERDDDTHHGLAAIPMPSQMAQTEPDALGPESSPAVHGGRLYAASGTRRSSYSWHPAAAGAA